MPGTLSALRAGCRCRSRRAGCSQVRPLPFEVEDEGGWINDATRTLLARTRTHPTIVTHTLVPASTPFGNRSTLLLEGHVPAVR